MLIQSLSEKLLPLIKNLEKTGEITGVNSGARSFVLSLLFHFLDKTACFITSTEEKAAQIYEEAKFYLGDKASYGNIHLFYEKEEFENHRLNVLEYLTKSSLQLPPHPTLSPEGRGISNKNLVITTIKAVLQKTISKKDFDKTKILIKKGAKLTIEELKDRLAEYGYERNYLVTSRGEFSNRGYIFDVFPSNTSPVRIEFLYDAVEQIKIFDPVSQRSVSSLDFVNILPFKEIKTSSSLTEYLPKDAVIIFDEPSTLKLHILEYLEEINIKNFDPLVVAKNKQHIILSHVSENVSALKLNFKEIYSFNGKMPQVYDSLKKWTSENKTTFIISSQYKRLKDILSKEDIASVYYEVPPEVKEKQNILLEGKIKNGFALLDINLNVIGDTELFSSIYRPKEASVIPKKSKTPKDNINIGDFVVHYNYGIAKFIRLNCIEIAGNKKDYLVLEFERGVKLFHPFDQMDVLEKYVAPEGSHVKLSKLGTSLWKKTRAKIKESVRQIAQQLLTLYAHRHGAKGHSFSPDTIWQSELEAAFPFEETPDQLEAIKNVKADMESDLPMDRLICGDAGFGKTEVALRAAFKCAIENKQTAILVPTTILAQQHYNTFSERLSTFPVKVEMLSRFRTPKEQKRIVEDVGKGKIDIIIGTHRLFQKDVQFKNLGLLVTDEEQHFGVKHKETLKEIKKNVDCLTLTATPIPRTFQMSISGIKDLSIINTPPEHRLPVKTHLLEYNKDIIKGAILRELERGGQVFYLNNRVMGIDKEAFIIQKLVPHALIAVAHGQMSEHELEKIMYDFTNHKYDVLVCTTIIESGMDIPEANTIIVNNSQNFGLSQLYQIRGRVGRRALQSFAYFLYPKETALTDNALKRLETLKEFSDLGSGFQIALKDLEIRGAGNLLGTTQHGFIEAVGFNEYCRLIKEAVKELRGEEVEEEVPPPVIEIPLQAFIPEEYIADKEVKLEYYKRLAEFTKPEQLYEVKKEFIDMFGVYPVEVENLFIVISLRVLALKYKIPKIKMTGISFNITGLNLSSVSAQLFYKLSNKYSVKIYLSNNDLVIEGIASRGNWFEILDDVLNSVGADPCVRPNKNDNQKQRD